MENNNLINQLDEKFQGIVENDHIPSLVISIVKEGSVLFSKAYGYRNLDKKEKADLDTLYRIASCTKSFTALGILQLFDQGKLNLQDPIVKYLPNLKISNPINPITIHHLLNQTSGIPDTGYVENLYKKHILLDNSITTITKKEEYYDFVNGMSDFLLQPGKRFMYSNSNYFLLGEIIEKISGLSYEEYISQNILKPLQMTRSTFSDEIIDKDENIQSQYIVSSDSEGKIQIIERNFPGSECLSAAGGLFTSANEISNYMIALLNSGTFQNSQIIQPSSIEKLFTISHSPCDMLQELGANGMGSSGREGYGYGWLVMENFFGHKVVVIPGGVFTSTATIILIPDLKLGIFECVNAGENVNQNIVPTIIMGISQLLGHDPEKSMSLFQVEGKKHFMCGKYETYQGIQKISIIRKGFTLFLIDPNGNELPLSPKNMDPNNLDYYFECSPTGISELSFSIDWASGNVDLLWNKYHFKKKI